MRRPHGPIARLLLASSALTVAAVTASALAVTPAQAAPTTATIRGTVTGGGRPLQGVVVEAGTPAFIGFNTVFLVDVETRTAADGSYTLTGVPTSSGERVQFLAAGAVGGTSATGYADRCVGSGSDCAVSGRDFTFAAGRTVGIDATLTRAAVIEGRLVDALGRGVGRAPVELYRHPNPDQADDGEFPRYSATSDANGNFVFPGLAANTWGLCVSTPQAPLTGTPNRDGYVSTCRAVPVTAGQVRAVSTVLTAGGGVSGAVVNQTGQPVVGATVSGSRFPLNPSTTTGSNGTFRLGHLVPGDETLCVSAPRSTLRCDVPVTVVSFGTTQVGRIVLRRTS